MGPIFSRPYKVIAKPTHASKTPAGGIPAPPAGLPARRPRQTRSVLLGKHDGNDRLAVVSRPAHGLEPHQRWRSLPVVVADVNRERQDRPAVLPAERPSKHRQYVSQAAGLVLTDHARQHRDALPQAAGAALSTCERASAPKVTTPRMRSGGMSRGEYHRPRFGRRGAGRGDPPIGS